MNASRIDDIAADWVARLDAGPLPPESAALLDRWLAEDPRHAGAYARARAVFAQLDRARALGPGYDPRRHARDGGAVSPRMRRRGWIMASAATVLLALGAGFGLQLLTGGGSTYGTSLGEVRHLPLDDGSTMSLNTGSRARVVFSAQERRVLLLEGEALFDVARDPLRPFVVESGGIRVQAIGTSFTVRRLPGATVEVTVREGEVRLQRADDPEAAPASLVANMRALSMPGKRPQVQRIDSRRVEQRLSWRDGMLSFNGDTLAEAAAEFSRYSRTRILIEDDEVARLRVVGLYAANDPGGFAQAVALSQGLDSERVDGDVRLRKRARH
ncbi:FecR family protein [Luteimonas salinilitoris]|uniref:FecR domain-containing protein n=1 Tax=Luteimonas salinilitoris TaxID=3237697 RepID=A0ABV4HVC3_9GAMM